MALSKMGNPSQAFPPNVWIARYIAPGRKEDEPKDYVSNTVVHVEGMMYNPLETQLGKNIRAWARSRNLGYLAVVTRDCNGLGPIQELDLEFAALVATLIETLKNIKFGFGTKDKILLVGFSFGGWTAFLAALSQELGDWVSGVLLLAPAVGCLLPVYQNNLLKLKALGRQEQVDALARGEVIRLDPRDFPKDKFFPMSQRFQESSWGFSLERLNMLDMPNMPNVLNLKNIKELKVPMSLIVGEEDERVSVQEIEALYQKLPPGNKRLTKMSGLGHDFNDNIIFGTVVRPELERLALLGVPNLAPTDLLEGMTKENWVLTRNHRHLEYLHLATGKSFRVKAEAMKHDQDAKDQEKAMSIPGPPTNHENMWSEGRTETELVHPQIHPFDLPSLPGPEEPMEPME